MEKIIFANIIVFVITSGVFTVIGLDMKKWYSWLVGLYGFLSGCSVGFLREDGSPSLLLGLIFVIVAMSSAAMTRYSRQRYGREAAEDWLTRYGQGKNYSLLARMIEKLLGKR